MRSKTTGAHHVRIYDILLLVTCTIHYVDVKARATCNSYSTLKDESTVATKITGRISIQKL
jgi:hypothetical protein